jgi:ribosomal protein L37AE/L43A
MNAHTIKTRTDDSNCEHLSVSGEEIAGMFVWKCPKCKYELTRPLDSAGVPVGYVQIVER